VVDDEQGWVVDDERGWVVEVDAVVACDTSVKGSMNEGQWWRGDRTIDWDMRWDGESPWPSIP
jgi:hypothetical protein